MKKKAALNIAIDAINHLIGEMINQHDYFMEEKDYDQIKDFHDALKIIKEIRDIENEN